mmetsp:Transcript_8995/g.37106  ORF Transcript_8995/g.37106 Transcript_8995/m.37106 type:complete len:564 (-) Transcript_8995:71-1762(-)
MEGRAQFRSRRKFTSPGQKRLLEFVYSIYPKPSKEFQRYLADLLGMEVKRVRVWFQNKRTRGSATGDQLLTSEREVHERMREEIGDLLSEFEAARKEQRAAGSGRYQVVPSQQHQGSPAEGFSTFRSGPGHMASPMVGQPNSGRVLMPASPFPRTAPTQQAADLARVPHGAQGYQQPREYTQGHRLQVASQEPASANRELNAAFAASATPPSSRPVQATRAEDVPIDFTLMNRIVVAVLNGNVPTLRETLQSPDLAGLTIHYLNYGDNRVNVLNSASSTGSFKDYPAIMAALLDHGLDPFHPAHRAALHYAIHIRAHPALRFLLEMYVPASLRDGNFDTPLHVAARVGDNVAAKLLLDHEALIDANNGSSETPLHVAVCSGSLSVVELLLASGADVNCRTDKGDSALHLALQLGKVELARVLLQRKPRLDMINTSLDSPLHELMMSSISSQQKLSLLYLACQLMASDDEQVARVLQLRNSDGETLLHIACIAGNEQLTDALLQYGFDPTARTFSSSGKRSAGMDALRIAQEYSWSGVEKSLVSFSKQRWAANDGSPPASVQVA